MKKRGLIGTFRDIWNFFRFIMGLCSILQIINVLKFDVIFHVSTAVRQWLFFGLVGGGCLQNEYACCGHSYYCGGFAEFVKIADYLRGVAVEQADFTIVV